MALVPSLAASFELESARRITLDTPAAIDTLAQELQPLGSRLDVVFANRKDWPTEVRVAAAIARCASQYPVPPDTHTGPRGQGPSLLDAPACLMAALGTDQGARRLAVDGARSRLRELPAKFKRGRAEWYDRSLYEFVAAGLVLGTLTPIRDGRPEPGDEKALRGLLDDSQKPLQPRIELAYALLATQWADPARVATTPFDEAVRLALVRLGLAEGGKLGTLLLPAHRREDPEFSRRLAAYSDTIEALRKMGRAAALRESPRPDAWPQVVQPITLEALGPLQVEYMRGYYEAKGDDVLSDDLSLRVLQYVPDNYRAELVRRVKGRYLYDEAVWELTSRQAPTPETLRALIEAGYVPWRVDVTRAVPRLLFDPPPQPLRGAHVPRAPTPLRQMTFAKFRGLMPDTAARIIAAIVPPECADSLQSVYVESDVSRGIASNFALRTRHRRSCSGCDSIRRAWFLSRASGTARAATGATRRSSRSTTRIAMGGTRCFWMRRRTSASSPLTASHGCWRNTRGCFGTFRPIPLAPGLRPTRAPPIGASNAAPQTRAKTSLRRCVRVDVRMLPR